MTDTPKKSIIKPEIKGAEPTKPGRDKTMTKEELKARIEKVKKGLFMINMIDHWSRQDEEEYDNLRKELEDLHEKLKTVE